MEIAERTLANASVIQASSTFVVALALRVFTVTAVKTASSAWIATGSVHGTKLAIRTAGVIMTANAGVIIGSVETRACNAIPPTLDRIAVRFAIRKTPVTVQAGVQLLASASVMATHREVIALFVSSEHSEMIARQSAQPT